MNNIIVSICSITYNHALFIRQCLDGFLMQKTNFPFEIIINDDCSTDGTTAILREYESQYPDLIKVIYHEKNLYSQGEREIFQKFVFPLVHGKYVALCEGDDYWTDPFKLQKQVNILESHPECSLCFHPVDYVSEFPVDLNPYDENFKSGFSEVGESPVSTCSILFRRKCLKDLPTSKYFKIGDSLIVHTCSIHGKFYGLNDKMATYRRHSNGWTKQTAEKIAMDCFIHFCAEKKAFQNKIPSRIFDESILNNLTVYIATKKYGYVKGFLICLYLLPLNMWIIFLRKKILPKLFKIIKKTRNSVIFVYHS